MAAARRWTAPRTGVTLGGVLRRDPSRIWNLTGETPLL